MEDYKDHTPRASSEITLTLTDDQKERLLESNSTSDFDLKTKTKKSRFSHLSYVVVILILSNITLAAFLIIQQQRSKPQPRPSWQPPERYHKRVFEYQDAYSGEPRPESAKAWTKLIPMGKGFVIVPNDTVIPDMPMLDKSLPEQHAMVSVFHQLHCLYVTRAAYFSARSGNIDEINNNHLMHCWDYLRQAVICAGDTTLEWIQAPPNGTGSTGWGYQHVCKDYSAIFSWATEHRLTDTKKIFH